MIKKFKNDKERIAFLEDYRNEDNGWKLWKGDMDLQRRWWRLELADWTFVVEEEERTYHWPKTHKTWTVKHWFIIPLNADGTFGDYVGSRTMALTKLKELEKAK